MVGVGWEMVKKRRGMKPARLHSGGKSSIALGGQLWKVIFTLEEGERNRPGRGGQRTPGRAEGLSLILGT